MLAAARGRVVSYKNRLIAIDPARVELDLVPAVREGLRLQVEHLSEKSDSFSLPAWAKWARMVDDTRNKKGWPKVFADGRGTGVAARVDLHQRAEGARCASCTPTSSTRRRRCSESRPAAARPHAWRAARRARGTAIVDVALPPGDDAAGPQIDSRAASAAGPCRPSATRRANRRRSPSR